MLKVLVMAALLLAAIVVCVLALAAFKPARFTMKRSTIIRAAPVKVFALINDLHRWPEWSAEDRDDPRIKRTYSGEPAGKGAVCFWDGDKSGKVRLEIVESNAGTIRVKADWEKPFKARNMNVFLVEPQGEDTRVTWTLDGENVFALKVMTVFVNADRLMGSHFENGLAALKAAAEK